MYSAGRRLTDAPSHPEGPGHQQHDRSSFSNASAGTPPPGADLTVVLGYKTAWHGGTLIVADRWFASSKTCSICGAVKAKLALCERRYVCEACRTVLDRDVNAAVNLARLAGSASDSNGRGADRKTGHARQVAVKRQPGRAPARKTGSLPPQGESAA
jgi:hypothetical protein